MNAEKLVSGLAVLPKILRGDIKSPRRPSFVDRNIHASNPGVVHPHVRHQIAAGVHYRDVHRLADLLGLLLSSGDYSPCVSKRYHTSPPATKLARGGNGIIGSCDPSSRRIPCRSPLSILLSNAGSRSASARPPNLRCSVGQKSPPVTIRSSLRPPD